MSINKKRFSLAALICAEILILGLLILAQDLEANIKINPATPNTAQVSGKMSKPRKANWFFIKTIVNADNLGARISDLQLFDEQNRAVIVKKFTDGEYLADSEATYFQYRINLESLPNAATKAHVSWISDEQGILMLDDLLPQSEAFNRKVSAKIKIEMPDDWKIFSIEKNVFENVFDVESVGKAVFAIGKGWRETKTANLNLLIADRWQFTDAEAAQMADAVYEEYKKMFGETPNGKTQIFLKHLPKEFRFGRWKAETRGRTLTILSADEPFKSQSIQLLHEQLRHELFHLWIPNNLDLTGNYDWFYEGFTVYQALRTGLQMNQIRFEDFLATLAEAYRFDGFQTDKVSLIESSKNRWSGTNPQVYARGMLIAFLCDVATLKDGKDNHSIENVFRDIYRKHSFPNKEVDGNTAILNVLRTYKSLDSIVKKHIEGAENIAWETVLKTIGIEMTTENSFVKLRVKAKLSGRQKDLLDELGYSNWQKLSQKSK